jgi:aspartate/methionine/tyrosine aminotransferase
MTRPAEARPTPGKIATTTRLMLSQKAEYFTESVIREMTRLALEYDAVNLAQGFPDFPAPAEVKEAAREAIAADDNQYAITWGAKPLRDAIVEKFARTQGVTVDPEREITVCCGSTEAMISSLMAIINPGDEVVVFEPFYENYGPDAILSGATPRFVSLRPPSWEFDREELARAFGPRTKAIIVNTPNNPTGKVFTREELEFIRDLCLRWNAFAITDEIYEHIIYDGARHISIASLEGMRENSITINGLSKTYGVTGWRVGWAIAPPGPTDSIRKVHDFLTVGAAAPLQAAGAFALKLPASYYQRLAESYRAKRDRMLGILEKAGFECFRPRGAYYIMTDISRFGFPDDVTFARDIVQRIGIAVVPGSSFYNEPADGARQVRFTFCKKEETLAAAAERLSRLRLS